jgi:hypothetical protein
MKVRIVATGTEEHIPFAPQLVDVLVKAGIVERVDEKKPDIPRGTARWAIQGGPKQDIPVLTITASCDVCNQKMWGNPKPTVEAVGKMIFWHCGRGEKVPSDVATAYIQRGGGTPAPFSMPVTQWGDKPDGRTAQWSDHEPIDKVKL